MLNVLHVITGLNDGGAEAVLFRLCIHDANNKHCVVSMMDEGKYGPLLRNAGVSVSCLGMKQGKITVSGLWRLWRLLRQQKPDVVQTWMYHADLIGGVLARLAGIQKIYWGVRHSTLDADNSKGSTVLVAKICALISGWVPVRIICCAQKALEVHKKLGYASHKLHVISNGYDLDRFFINRNMREKVRDELGCGQKDFLFGMVARFDSLKDHKNLLAALFELKQRGVCFRCVLVGRGLDKSNIQIMSWLTNFNLLNEVLLCGQRTDIPDVMSALDVHVLSSAGEAFPNVVAEAMACGVPVVATDVGDAAIIVGETGWIVSPRDSAALAEGLFCALDMPSIERVAMGRAARERIVSLFSIEKMVSSYNSVWQQK